EAGRQGLQDQNIRPARAQVLDVDWRLDPGVPQLVQKDVDLGRGVPGGSRYYPQKVFL
ncbi:hypothetical protein IWW50_000533, partial [Coemansia erecta]